MKIKTKILLGFSLLIIMLLIAGTMSIYEFSRLSKSVSSLIDDNYKTIEASKTMIQALEREDSGILLLVLGHWKEGRKIINTADSMFQTAFHIAQNNITEDSENQYLDQIEQSYFVFKTKFQSPIVSTEKENNVQWYFDNVHFDFLEVRSNVELLMALNQDSMHWEASILKDKAQRAIMPGIVAIVSALIFLILFNFFINLFLVRPIKKIIQALRNYKPSSKFFDADISSHDELKDIETELQGLIYRIEKNKQLEG